MKKYLFEIFTVCMCLGLSNIALAMAGAPEEPSADEDKPAAAEDKPATASTEKTTEAPVDEAAALTPKEREVYTLLTGYEKIPEAKDFIRMDKKTALDALVTIASNKDLKLFVRARAISSLVFFGGEQAETIIKTTLSNPGEPLAMKRTAIKALGQTAGKDAPKYLLPMLADNDKFVREAVIFALRHIKTPDVETAFKARLEIESEDFLKTELNLYFNPPEQKIEPKEIETKK